MTLALGELERAVATKLDAKVVTVAEHQHLRRCMADQGYADVLRIEPSTIAKEVGILDPDLKQVGSEEMSESISYRLAQRPGPFVGPRIIRRVVTLADSKLSCLEAPGGTGKKAADVSTLACTVIDKMDHHLPFFCQHQRARSAAADVEASGRRPPGREMPL